MSIEGTNVFNSHLPVEEVKKNIAEVKTWEEPLFFITFTYYFTITWQATHTAFQISAST